MKSLIKQNPLVLFHRQSDRMPALDGIRAIAILLVVGLHLIMGQAGDVGEAISQYDTDAYFDQIVHSRIGRILARGEFGVDLFFVLSGFLIGSILFKELFATKTLNLKRFYTRRFIRLLPVYFFVLFFGYLLYALFLPAQIEGQTFWTIMANVVYVNNLLPIEDAYMIWCWSLAIEEQFYTVCPLLLLLIFWLAKTKRARVISFISLISILLVVRAFCVSYFGLSAPVPHFDFRVPESMPYFDSIYNNPHTRANQLLIGVFAAFLYLRYGDQLKRICHTWWFQGLELFSLAIMGWLLTDWIYTLYGSSYSTYLADLPQWARYTYLVIFQDLFALATAVVMLGVLSGGGIVNRVVGGFLSMKFWYPIAQLSYSWYLVHIIVMHFMFPHTSEWFYDTFGFVPGYWLNGIVVSSVALFISYLMFIFIEKPSMDIRRAEWVKRFHGS